MSGQRRGEVDCQGKNLQVGHKAVKPSAWLHGGWRRIEVQDGQTITTVRVAKPLEEQMRKSKTKTTETAIGRTWRWNGGNERPSEEAEGSRSTSSIQVKYGGKMEGPGRVEYGMMMRTEMEMTPVGLRQRWKALASDSD